MPSPFELHREVKRGNLARTRELLREGAKLNTADRIGYTPLRYALESAAASVEMVEFLLEQGADVAQTISPVDGVYRSMLAVCLRGGDPLKLAAVLKHGAEIRPANDCSYDALMDAACGHALDRDPRLLDVLRILIDRGVTLNGVNGYGESALRLLSRVGRFDAVRLLLDAGADETQLAWTPLHRAAALGSFAEVQALVEGGAQLEALDWWERTPGWWRLRRAMSIKRGISRSTAPTSP